MRQLALAAGTDLSGTLAFWERVLGLTAHARFDPPGIAFIVIGGVRLFFAPSSPPGTVYLDASRLDRLCRSIAEAGARVTEPKPMHLDTAGQFGPAGEAEWMSFVHDPAGNTIGLVERRPA